MVSNSFKLLDNLEENIFYLIHIKSDKEKMYNEIDKYDNKDNTNKYSKNIINEYKNISNDDDINLKPQYSLHDTIDKINYDTSYNKDIIKSYFQLFNICETDIDILNLIVKYIITCGKIIKSKNSLYLGVLELNYHPSNDIPSLSENYFIDKYKKNKKHYKYTDCNTMLRLSLNILLPFSIEYSLYIYNKL